MHYAHWIKLKCGYQYCALFVRQNTLRIFGLKEFLGVLRNICLVLLLFHNLKVSTWWQTLKEIGQTNCLSFEQYGKGISFSCWFNVVLRFSNVNCWHCFYWQVMTAQLGVLVFTPQQTPPHQELILPFQMLGGNASGNKSDTRIEQYLGPTTLCGLAN